MPDTIKLAQRLLGFLLTPRLFERKAGGARAMNGGQGLASPRLFSRTYDGVIGRIHIHDDMLQAEAPDHIGHYIAVGLSAMQNIEASLEAAGRKFTDIESCLDMPSGYGRVTRHLQTKIQPSRITACDIDEQAVRFVAAEFGVKPLVSTLDLRDLHFPETYDLIFVGSLFTHLDPESEVTLLNLFADALRPKGLLIFSTCGDACLEQLHIHGWMFAAKEKEYREQVGTQGIGFFPYFSNDPKWGVVIQSKDYLEKLMDEKFPGKLKLVRYAKQGLDAHQDVWSYQRL